ncbi:hypothetical protein [Cellulomonas fimi]|uniref:Polysaccharide biosynthesis protein n=1 Tax=Cellulomonas fimi TaxID=1708 RepID=A0A7Y0QI21_CELFI|nr:hypothetical protein [Cellulomonas fimi]NMR20880.1 hypothetical protein [Cellulomonas fimi]
MTSSTPTITPRGATGVGLASLVAAASGYLVLLIAARTLDPARNAEFLVFWALLFGLFGVLGGLQNEVTRAVRVARHAPAAPAGDPATGISGAPDAGPPIASAPPADTGVRVLPAALTIGGALALVVAATSPLWAGRLLGTEPWTLAVVLCVAVVAFAGHSGLAGALGGAGRWTTYARLVGAEAGLRLLLVGGVALAGAAVGLDALGVVGLETASAAAAAAWLLVLIASRQARANLGARADARRSVFARRAGQAMVGAASSAALVVGFPVLLRVTTSDAVYAAAAPLLLAVSMTRAPLLIPLTAYTGVAITHFLAHREQGVRPLVRLAGAVVGVGVLGAGAAGLVGPWLMVVLFGPAYDVAPWVLAALTLAAAVLALLTLTGAAVLSLGQHQAYAWGWVVATVVSFAVLLMPASIELRTALSLAVGPLVGVAVHAAVIDRARRAGR